MTISQTDLRKSARAKLRDAQVLLRAGRYDSAFYLSGYAIELALKARICQALKWAGYPETSGEFQNFQSFRTHNLVTLLALSAQEDRIRSNYPLQWSLVQHWNPELRYRIVGSTSQIAATDMINAVRDLVRIL